MIEHRLAGKTVKIVKGEHAGKDYRVEDLWQNVAGESWMTCNGNPACIIYALRGAKEELPIDNNVLYGKIGPLGHLIHESEVEEIDETKS